MGVDVTKPPRQYQEQIGQQLLENKNRNKGMGAAKPQQVEVCAMVHQEKVQAGGVGATPKLPSVLIEMHRSRKLDRDNKFFATKEILDGLCHTGLIPGDSEDEIDLKVEQVKVPRKEIKTVIEIEWEDQ